LTVRRKDMFQRAILSHLHDWKNKSDRKPLILRGARQVGKTTAVKLFSSAYEQFIPLNLDKPEEAKLFSRALSASELLQAIRFSKGLPRIEGPTLLFLDEVQNSPEAVASLRYFYEDLPEVHVIAAGSLLEVALTQKQIGIPVGRVEHALMYPLSFREFLEAIGEKQALEALDIIPAPTFALSRLLELFHRFALVGGMPEIVAHYAAGRDAVALAPLYRSLWTSFLDDIPKYARNETMKRVIRHCLEAAPMEAGERIRFAGFGKSNYRSREAGESLRTLEQAMLLHLFAPTTSTEIPLIPDRRKSPKLLFLDIGLVNFSAGIQGQYFEYPDLYSFYRGRVAEMIVGQELIAADPEQPKPVFWVREKSQAPAEVDFVLQHGSLAVPVEVKAGATGTLRSLHQFINRCPHGYAVRLYAGPLNVLRTKTPEGKPFSLLNLPYCFAGKLRPYVRWMIENG
jgi:predicted AAA+ superfamily ATPase